MSKKKELRNYQLQGIQGVLEAFRSGNKKVIYQLPTGGGKTITSSFFIYNYLKSNPLKNAVFFVHGIELLDQFKKTFESLFSEMEVGQIKQGVMAVRPDLRVNVAMIETGFNRLKNNKDFFGNNIGLMVVDECHIGSFDKIFSYFPETLIMGLSATPIRISKRNPLNRIYDEIVTSISIKELIEENSLSPNKTYIIDQGTNYSKIKKSGGDFNSSSMFENLSGKKHINNVVDVYNRICKGKKTLIFNASIEHSEMVDKVFKELGLPSEHLDGYKDKEDRERILKWFSETPNAILHNVGVLTMGYDEPSIMNVIVNRPTMSLALWLQMTGRGSRIYDNKSFFNIIDLGGNTERLGDWSSNFDWREIFEKAEYKEKDSEGLAPIKSCPECSYVMPINSIECPECGYGFSKEIEEEDKKIELKLIVDNFAEKVDLEKIDAITEENNWNKYASLHLLKNILVQQIKAENIEIDSVEYQHLKEEYMAEAKKWCHKNNKRFTKFNKDFAENILNSALNIKE